jgi:TPR repeat protein
MRRPKKNLGVMYHHGQGVKQDHVQAYKWYSLAAAQGHETAAFNLGLLAGAMTPTQIEEAERLAREWLAAHPR